MSRGPSLGTLILALIALILIFGAIGAVIFMLLWNWLVPLFFPEAVVLTFWQSWGICILLGFVGRMLFKGGSK